MRGGAAVPLGAAVAMGAGLGCNALIGLDPPEHEREPIEPAVVSLGPGIGLNLPDDMRYDGKLETMECLTLAVPDDGFAQVAKVEVTVGLAHVWLADLVIKVVSPRGAVTTLLSRAGTDELADASSDLMGSSNGDGSDLAVSHPITFQDEAPVPAERMGATVDNAGAVCRDDAICFFAPSPGRGPGTSLADFQGEPPAGDWRVCVADGDDSEPGAVDQVRISVLAR